MKKTIIRFFMLWNFEKEEAWLNKMGQMNYRLVSVTFGRYVFEYDPQNKYTVRMDYIEDKNSQEYVQFVEETGAKCVTKYLNWHYFVKNDNLGPFELFSNYESRLAYITRIQIFAHSIAPIGFVNIYFAFSNLVHITGNHGVTTSIGLLNLFVGLFIGFGVFQINQKKKAIKEAMLLND